jgi:hypothetical protein
MPPLPSPCSRNHLGTIRKPAAATLPYKIDFAAWLASLQIPATATTGDTIASATVGVVQTLGGVNVVAQSSAVNNVYFQLGGGQVGEYVLLCVDVKTTLGNADLFSVVVEIE